MMSVSWISLPPETMRRLADEGARPSGGGDATERRGALIVVACVGLLAVLAAFVSI